MLPKKIYVYEEEKWDGTKYLIASRLVPDDEKGEIGIYVLKETGKVRRGKWLIMRH
jgi:hypothetical protein